MLLIRTLGKGALLIGQFSIFVQAQNVDQGDRVQGIAQFMNESAENIQWLWLGGIVLSMLLFLLFIRWIHYAMIRRHKPQSKVPINKGTIPDPSATEKTAARSQPENKPADGNRRGKGKRRY